MTDVTLPVAKKDEVQFDPKALADQVKQRITASAMMLIPDDMWNKMLESEIADFFGWKNPKDASTSTYGGSYYRDQSDTRKTKFQAIVWEELDKVCRVKVKEMLDSKDWSGVWENGKCMTSEKVKEMVVAHAPEMFANIMSTAIQNVLMQAGFQIHR